MKKVAALILIACVLFSTGVSVYALAPPMPQYRYIVEIDDGNKVFVILWNNRICETFPKSGLYYNTAPFEVIYTIDAQFDFGGFYLSNDGFYFAQLTQFVYYDTGMRKLQNPAIRFFAHGEMIRSYYLSDLPIDYQKLIDFRVQQDLQGNLRYGGWLSTQPAIQWNNSNNADVERKMFCADSNILSVTAFEAVGDLFDLRNDLFAVKLERAETLYFDITTGRIIPDSGFATEHALVLLSHLSGTNILSKLDIKRYDVNGDGVVDTADALIILRIVAGLE
jgi:hypothetical protein